MKTVYASGTTMSYSQAGRGPGLVLLHGTNSDGHTSFGHVTDRFTDQRTVITLDFAGCGSSTIPDGDLSLALLVEQAAAAIRDAESGPVDLLGFSLGAVVAAATAAAHPDLVRRLVLVAGWSAGDCRHQMVFDTWSHLESLDPGLGVRYGLSLAFSPEFLAALGHDRLSQLLGRRFPPGTQRRIDLGRRIDIRDQLSRVTAPTLVIGLTRDYLVPASHSRSLHEAIVGSRYAEVDSGHVVFLEKPDEVVSLVRGFLLGGLEPARTPLSDT